MKGSAEAVRENESLVRSKTIIQLFDEVFVKDTVEKVSDGVNCQAFREFLLYLDLDSTSTPTNIRIKVQYLDRWTGKWHTYKQGLFASLYYEDTDLASGIQECFSGEVMGRDIRVTLTSVGTSGSAYFTASVAIEFRN